MNTTSYPSGTFSASFSTSLTSNQTAGCRPRHNGPAVVWAVEEFIACALLESGAPERDQSLAHGIVPRLIHATILAPLFKARLNVSYPTAPRQLSWQSRGVWLATAQQPAHAHPSMLRASTRQRRQGCGYLAAQQDWALARSPLGRSAMPADSYREGAS